MGHKTLTYKLKLKHNLDESYKHLFRLNGAFEQLNKKYSFPVDKESYQNIINNVQCLLKRVTSFIYNSKTNR